MRVEGKLCRKVTLRKKEWTPLLVGCPICHFMVEMGFYNGLTTPEFLNPVPKGTTTVHILDVSIM